MAFLSFVSIPLPISQTRPWFLNTADIYFDFNPPIQTNTTWNTFISELPTNTVNEFEVKVRTYPNPSSAFLIFEIQIPDPDLLHLIKIRSIDGTIVKTQEVSGNGIVSLNTSEMAGGTYTYELVDKNYKTLSVGKIVKQ